MPDTTTYARRYNDATECIGCRTSQSDRCPPTCPFVTGEFGSAVILRAAAAELIDHPAGDGYNIRASINAAAVGVVGRNRAARAAVMARAVLADFFVVNAAPPGSSILLDVAFVGQYLRLDGIVAVLYDAAAYRDSLDAEPTDIG